MVSVQNLNLGASAMISIAKELAPFIVHSPSDQSKTTSAADVCALILLPPQHHLLLRFHAHTDGVRVHIATDTAAQIVPHAHEFLRKLASAVATGTT